MEDPPRGAWPVECEVCQRGSFCDGECNECVVFGRAGCWSGVVCLVFAQLQIAIHGHLFKILVDEGIPQFQLLFFRSLSNTVLSLVTGLAIAHRRKLLLPKSIWLLSSMQGIFGNLGMIAFYISFTFMVEGDAMALIKLSPIFAFLLNCFLGWEPVTLQIASGVIICCVGGVIIEHPPFLFGGSTWDSSQMIGCGIALFSALFLALLFIATGKVGSRANTITLVLWFHFTGIFINATPLIANISSEQVFTPTRWNLLLLLAFCILSFTSACLNFRGIQLCNATLGTSLQTSAVIFSYMLGYWFLGEKITMFAIAGTAAIFLGILVIAHGKERLHKAGGTIGKIEDIGP